VTDPEGREKQGPESGKKPVERFHATSGHVTGAVALVVAGAVVLVGLVYGEGGYSVTVVLGAVLFGLLAYVVMLRPRVWATDDDLVMRNILHTEAIPLAAIGRVTVRQVLAVSAGERRFVSPAIGRSRRDTIKSQRRSEPESPTTSYPAFVEERITHLATEARTRQGIQRDSAEQAALAAGVRRTWAWPEIAALAAAGVALLVSVVA
jgi:hypothetical protein